jgi:hypothetical protein
MGREGHKLQLHPSRVLPNADDRAVLYGSEVQGLQQLRHESRAGETMGYASGFERCRDIPGEFG